MANQNHPSNLRLARSVYPWIGRVCVLLVGMISGTGLVLNHASDLGLDGKTVKSKRLKHWYGMELEKTSSGFVVGKHWITGVGGEWLFDGKAVGGKGRLMGAGKVGEWFVVAGKKVVWTMNANGALSEKFDAAKLPPGLIERIGVLGRDLAIETDAGQFLLKDWAEIERLDGKPADWFEAVELPVQNLGTMEEAESLSLTQLIQDLHSGRFFGPAGVVVYDLGTVLFLALALTGIWKGTLRRT